MDFGLTDMEVRVLGCLFEKERTTPEYYPLTLNALTAACNQKSNRFPVMTVTEGEVQVALETLRARHLAWKRADHGARVSKYEHNLVPTWGLRGPEVAALCVLMLRGPQTVGEIRGRTGRMHEFGTLEEVEQALARLSSHEAGPFVKELPRQPGRKECRYAHLLSGEPAAALIEGPTEVAPVPPRGRADRIAAFEEEVAGLRNEVAAMRKELSELRRRFG